MIWSALGCLAAAAGLSVIAPRVGRLIDPALATRLLSAVSLGAAVSLLWVIGLDAATSLAQIPFVARIVDLSPELLESFDPVPRWFAVICAAAAGVAIVAGVRTVAVRVRDLGRVRRAVAGASQPGDLLVLDTPRGTAFATPARGGRLVVSTGLLRSLAADERRALLAHEQAHLRHHHYWWVAGAEFAAAVCPLFRATARGVARSAERWADESAAAVVGDRRVVARALARAALHTTAAATPEAAVGGLVVDRVRAMLEPPPRRRLIPAWALVILVALTVVTASIVSQDADALFDQATVPVSHSGRR